MIFFAVTPRLPRCLRAASASAMLRAYTQFSRFPRLFVVRYALDAAALIDAPRGRRAFKDTSRQRRGMMKLYDAQLIRAALRHACRHDLRRHLFRCRLASHDSQVRRAAVDGKHAAASRSRVRLIESAQRSCSRHKMPVCHVTKVKQRCRYAACQRYATARCVSRYADTMRAAQCYAPPAADTLIATLRQAPRTAIFTPAAPRSYAIILRRMLPMRAAAKRRCAVMLSCLRCRHAWLCRRCVLLQCHEEILRTLMRRRCDEFRRAAAAKR